MNSKLPVEAHLTEEILVRFLDGELSRRAYERAARHLEACWTCRSKREQLRQAMDRFVYLEEALIDVAVTSPPRTWSGVRPNMFCESPSHSRNSLFAKNLVQTLGVCGAAFAVVMWLLPGSSVSAMEILERSAASERPMMVYKSNPLVLQNLRVESDTRAASWSLWEVPQSNKFRQVWNAAGEGHLRNELEEIYVRHGLDLKHPISASNHSRWRTSLARHQDIVRKQGNLVAVVTTNQDEVRTGEIAEAELWVRQSDWHPVRETFRIAEPGGREEYRIIETAFKVESLDAENARIFEPDAPVFEPVRPIATPAVPAPVDNFESAAKPAATALAEAEIEALALLHEMDADRLDSAEVELRDNRVQVTAYPENQDRKLELESHLAVVPLVNATIHLLSEAPPAAVRSEKAIEVTNSPASEPLFLKPLVEQTGSLEIANRIVSDQMALLRRLCIELEALRDLEKRFPEPVRESLPARSLVRLDALALDHLDAARQVWTELERNATPLVASIGGSSETAKQGSFCGEWYHLPATPAAAAERLEDLYARAFTTLAGATADVSGAAVVAEIPQLRAKLSADLAEGCLR